MGLSDGRKRFPIGLAVLIQYRSVTATQPPSQPPSHVAVAITLNAKASSLKTVNYTYLLVDASNKAALMKVTSMKDLGVIFDSKLNFEEYISDRLTKLQCLG